MAALSCPMCNQAMPLQDASAHGALAQYPNFPFCSKRCKLVDLGHWFDENYTISRPADDNSEFSD